MKNYVCFFDSIAAIPVNFVIAKRPINGISSGKTEEDIVIMGSNDGVGFDPVAIASKIDDKSGFGLFSIREQVESFSGQLKIESEHGGRSSFTIIMPLPKKA